ncbi:hypothetical protein, variant 1 [Verruconis gallopava]|uniref:Ion transport domain-containing protein n=1 Tax=Verruconis gallopava TaxID=253628 RepID=A0A0D2A8L9_9PEZI|nr:hypothetical protein, variant 1 [Verruconis gallopava]KIW02915.1 hypothetical protein, variant 1 [Verruconis gallopava]
MILPHRPDAHRTISDVLRQVREREEQENLLGDDENANADHEGCLNLTESFVQNPYQQLPVYRNIHRIRRLMLASIDDPYTLEQLQGPRINVALVRPLVDRLYDPQDISIVFCLLVNRQEFIRDQQYQAHHQTVNLTRATLCELVATRVLRRHSEDNPGRDGLLLLANILVAGFEPFQNAPEEVLQQSHHSGAAQWFVQKRNGYERKLTALEIAIISESKLFLSSSACQKVVDAVYTGRIVYTPTSFIDLIPDHYKHKTVALYSPNKASLLNQYRLIVPRTRNLLEIGHFVILLILYSVTMVYRDGPRMTGWELAFLIYAAGWVLDEFASTLEHGWQVHTQNLWSFLDIGFVFIYWVYFVLRMIGIAKDNDELGRQALDVLACAAPIVFPRIAFNLMSENVLFLSLRVMMKQFVALTALAIWCFGGFLLAMRWLSRWHPDSIDHRQPAHDPTTIGKWMIWIWFGLDGTGITRSSDFHMILGPILMIAFAFLGNTLFLTILVSMLSNTFSKLVADATAEIQFRRAVLTFEGVKSDAIFAYRPPFNILALVILVPLKFVVSERWFHKIHITAARILNLPILLAVNSWERKRLWKKKDLAPGAPLKRVKGRGGLWAQLSVHADIQAVFDAEPPESMVKEIEEEDMLDDDVLDVGIARNRSISPGSASQIRRRRFSSIVPRD